MDNDIQVMANGYVHVGQNNWVSLEAIQQAVLAKQTNNNPGLSIFTVPGEGRKPGKPTPQAPSSNEEPLPLPSTLVRNDKPLPISCGCDEHLPLPSTLRQTK